MVPSRKGLLLVLLLAGLAAGCGSSQVKIVNQAAIAVRPSLTDDVSRVQALQSLTLLQERAEDYRVGPGDLLEVSIFEWELREEQKTATFRVAESGIVSLPVIADLAVGGLSVREIKAMVEARLTDGGFLRDPRVSVEIVEFRSKRVAVGGAVTDPGVYTLRQNVATLLDILMLAGGITDRAGYVLYVIRPQAAATITTEDALADAATEAASEDALKEAVAQAVATSSKRDVISIDLYELLIIGDLKLNVVLRNGDIINVPPADEFSVIGFVREPGSFPLKKPTTVLEGIAQAGGLMEREASPRSCALKRRTPGGEVIVPLDLVAISRGKKPNFFLAPDDVIDVRQTALQKIAIETFDAVRSVMSVGYSLNP